MSSSIRIGEFLHRKKVPVEIDPALSYSLVTVKLHHKGVVQRERKLGSLLGSNMYRVSAGDFILSGIDARNGAFGIVPPELDGAIVTNDFWYFNIDETKVKRDFFYWLSSTPLFLDACQKSSKGETQRIRLQKELFNNFEFHFPPADQQEEFLYGLTKIDASLTRLSDESNLQSSYLTKLRQAILQEAIEGKLTLAWRKAHPVLKGDPETDAQALLEKIKAEKERLVAEGKIKKQKLLAPIKPEDIPFGLPKGWLWTRLGEVSLSAEAGKSYLCNKDSVTGDAWGVIKTSAITSGLFLESESKLYSRIKPEDVRVKINFGDLLFCRSSGSKMLAGRSCIVREISKNLLLSDKSIRLTLSMKIESNLINIFNNSEFGDKYRLSLSTHKSTSMNNVIRDDMLKIPIPLPPLAEQKAIVERVEKLLAIVDELEKQVAQRKLQAQALLQVVLAEAFEGN